MHTTGSRKWLVALVLLVAIAATVSAVEDLKTFYEQEKARLLESFKAPAIGSTITVAFPRGTHG